MSARSATSATSVGKRLIEETVKLSEEGSRSAVGSNVAERGWLVAPRPSGAESSARELHAEQASRSIRANLTTSATMGEVYASSLLLKGIQH